MIFHFNVSGKLLMPFYFTSPFIHVVMQMKTKKNNNSAIKVQRLISPPENGVRKVTSGLGGEVSRLSVIRTKGNTRRKRLQIRGFKYNSNINSSSVKEIKESHVEEESERLTEMSLSLSLSSSSDNSTEKCDVLSEFERRTRKGKDSLRSLSHGFVSVIGRRREMEDAVTAEVGLLVKHGSSANLDHHGADEKYDFFAVYDGHGGSRVAEACKERLHRVLVEIITEEYGKEGNNDDDSKKNIVWETVMEDCFEKMDEEVNRGTLREEMVGSTAVVAVVGTEKLVVANCGDSRVVLSRGGGVVPLSIDHKPDRPDELKRVEDAGGRVINWYGHRIQGVLATSRSIGDQYLKPFVISKPEVMVIDRTDSDEFLILASDGLWDVVSNEVACQVVRRCFSGQIKWANSVEVGHQSTASRAAAALAELAMARGSSDNISVVVVELNKPTKFH